MEGHVVQLGDPTALHSTGFASFNPPQCLPGLEKECCIMLRILASCDILQIHCVVVRWVAIFVVHLPRQLTGRRSQEVQSHNTVNIEEFATDVDDIISRRSQVPTQYYAPCVAQAAVWTNLPGLALQSGTLIPLTGDKAFENQPGKTRFCLMKAHMPWRSHKKPIHITSPKQDMKLISNSHGYLVTPQWRGTWEKTLQHPTFNARTEFFSNKLFFGLGKPIPFAKQDAGKVDSLRTNAGQQNKNQQKPRTPCTDAHHRFHFHLVCYGFIWFYLPTKSPHVDNNAGHSSMCLVTKVFRLHQETLTKHLRILHTWGASLQQYPWCSCLS